MCPNCGIPLVYHHDYHIIKCHTCSFKDDSPTDCPQCGSTDLTFRTIGTKSLYDHIKYLFKDAKIMRFDADSSAPDQYYRHIDDLKSGKVDIIIGTQIISKGIDLPKLSVVGVINADTGLNLPDYRAEETTYQQLYQITGRAIRGHRKSKCIIQSRISDNPIMASVLQRDFEGFLNYELLKRKKFYYPPYCYLAMIKVSKKTPISARSTSEKLYKMLITFRGIEVLGPSPSFFEKKKGYFTWQLILKSPKRSLLLDAAKIVPPDCIVDIDPISLL
jgi:primosomal protein N' (replication factor Y) (superfamily II helicase)